MTFSNSLITTGIPTHTAFVEVPGKPRMAVETFGQWLKRRRGGLGLTQAELAACVGYAAETIQKVEADKLRPSKQLATKLAAALELRPKQYPAFIRFARDEGEIPDLPTQT